MKHHGLMNTLYEKLSPLLTKELNDFSRDRFNWAISVVMSR